MSMYLSYQHIEEIAAAVVADFRRSASIDSFCTPIDRFARNYMGLNISYARLSDDGSILGLTAYADTTYRTKINGVECYLPISASDIVLDACFINDLRRIERLSAKCRFTLAHECAHQLLFEMESDAVKSKQRQKYEVSRTYSLRDLKTREDWNEWQANALGAAILMPSDLVAAALLKYAGRVRTLTSYDGCFNRPDYLVLQHLCKVFAVSHSAMAIRLEQLGLCVKKPRSEFYDPTEITV